MTRRSAAQAYRQSSMENPPPVKIVRLLYEGALRAIDRAAACDPRKDRHAFVSWISKADDIVSELRLALATEPAPEVARALGNLYEFAQFQFAQALILNDIQPLAHARRSLATLLEGC